MQSSDLTSTTARRPLMSVVVPVYRNADNIPDLLAALSDLQANLSEHLEVVFVVDGSPDQSHARLREALPMQPFASKLVLLSRNFGSFAAIRAGLAVAVGDLMAVLAADLQEPPELLQLFFANLQNGDCDVVLGTRNGRDDSWMTRVLSSSFWGLYRRFVQPQMPPGGLDVFACNRNFAAQLLRLEEANSSLVGLIIWLGYRVKTIPYRRLSRRIGKSAWTFRRKWKYLLDSIFAFTDLPFRILSLLGMIAVASSAVISTLALVSRMAGRTHVPGYTITIILIMFFGGINALGFSLLGGYVWRAFENTKRRPNYLVLSIEAFSLSPGQSDSVGTPGEPKVDLR